MKHLNYITIISLLVAGLTIAACNNTVSQKNDKKTTEEASKEAPKDVDLKEQSESFDKSMDNINDAMDLARVLNEKIQIVEKQFETGQINREKADQLINDLNQRYSKATGEEDEYSIGVFPTWLTDMNITEPQGLTFNTSDSYLTKEENLQDGYNSALFIYTGTYQQAMAEAKRIAEQANIPLSESYQKAKDLADKLGKEIEGIEGVTYLNYKFGDGSFDGKYKISLSVDKSGKLTMHVVDEKMKNARKEATGLPKY
ncbi:MAG: hypothetical protein CVU00_02150 [Bacteroidetes bacterium HGW-Bacteroidetes-17]|jgi:hypothetical protein|nr:MAG: hypothetical protein CVU00_02150 [Bacteroidetes bacterium HGW-Bacteroidetes-17]